MKKIFVVLLVFLTGGFFTGCSLTEEPKGIISPNGFYKSKADFDAAMAGAFRTLINNWGAFEFNNAFLLLAGAEDVTSRPPATNLTKFENFVADGSAEQVMIVWKALYRCLNECNLIISHVGSAELSQSDKDAYEGEARTLRAWCYYFLVRAWGKIPIITVDNYTNAANVGESEIGDIYAYIIADLQKAETILSDDPSEKILPTLGSAELLLADVYLTMTGWPLNETSYYEKARDMAQKVIELSSYSLEPKFANLWIATKARTNTEVIWGFSGVAGQSGVPGTRYHVSGRPAEEGGWCDMFSDSLYYEAFPDGPRKEATFHSYFYFYKNGKLDSVYWKNSTASYRQPYFGKWRDAGAATRSDKDPLGQLVYKGSGGAFFVVQRYAEAYLIYAEAANMAEGGPSTTAYEYLNKIKRRAAGLNPNVPNASVDISGLNQQQFDDEVIEERMWEFAFELRRWFDIVRKDILMTAPLIQAEHGPGSTYPVHAYNRLLPKYNTDVTLIDGLNQNEGY